MNLEACLQSPRFAGDDGLSEVSTSVEERWRGSAWNGELSCPTVVKVAGATQLPTGDE